MSTTVKKPARVPERETPADIFRVRNCRDRDLPYLIDIWSASGITQGLSETIPELKRMLTRNPGTCLVGMVDWQVVAGVLGGFDGRRGLVHHLAVDPKWRGRGFGRLLMQELEERFRRMGVVKLHLWVESPNQDVTSYYQSLGFELRDLVTMSKTLLR